MTHLIGDTALSLLVVTQGQWGERIADYVGRSCPPTWTVKRWAAPPRLPLLIDDPAEFLPPALPPVELLLALGETVGLAQLIPDIAKQTGAHAVIAPIDRNESLPPGLVSQLRQWLWAMEVAVVFPKPFCSLTPTTYSEPPIQVHYANPTIAAFAHVFGKPRFQITVSADHHLSTIQIERNAACGCAYFVASGLEDHTVPDAVPAAGLLHHHYPCLASMQQDTDYQDTLMHVSGRIVQAAVREQISAHLEPTAYLRPAGRVAGE